MKILNLYSGIGGNRKLWGEDHEITAIEYYPKIAEIYQDFFTYDKVIVGDAHKYLLNHYMNYDFIWSSPPCSNHSDIRRCGVQKGQYEAKYPDMQLYQEIILLKNFSKGFWVVENVIPYYQPLIEPTAKIQRHLFWSNFLIDDFTKYDQRIHSEIIGSSRVYGFSLDKYTGIDKIKCLRNCVFPELGLHIFDCAFKRQTKNVQYRMF